MVNQNKITKGTKMIEKIKKNLNKIEYAIMFLIFIYIMFLQPRHVMWLDELDWGVGILIENNSLKDIILAVLKTGENLPLFYITIYLVIMNFSWFWNLQLLLL